jgi:hypothetical protein
MNKTIGEIDSARRALRRKSAPPQLPESVEEIVGKAATAIAFRSTGIKSAGDRIQIAREEIQSAIAAAQPDVENQVDAGVTAVFAQFPGDSWRQSALRDVVTAALASETQPK